MDIDKDTSNFWCYFCCHHYSYVQTQTRIPETNQPHTFSLCDVQLQSFTAAGMPSGHWAVSAYQCFKNPETADHLNKNRHAHTQGEREIHCGVTSQNLNNANTNIMHRTIQTKKLDSIANKRAGLNAKRGNQHTVQMTNHFQSLSDWMHHISEQIKKSVEYITTQNNCRQQIPTLKAHIWSGVHQSGLKIINFKRITSIFWKVHDVMIQKDSRLPHLNLSKTLCYLATMECHTWSKKADRDISMHHKQLSSLAIWPRHVFKTKLRVTTQCFTSCDHSTAFFPRHDVVSSVMT